MKYRDDAIRRYFGSENDRFWRWQDEGESVGWIDGKTISFAEELAALIKHLTPSNLPRFGSLLLLVAATRNSWFVDSSEIGILSGMLARQTDSHQLTVSGNHDLLQKVLAGLHRIRDLEPKLRDSLEAKKVIAELVFESQVSEFSEEESLVVAEALRPGLSTFLDHSVGAVSVGYSPLMLTKDLAELSRGLHRVSAEKIQLRMKTGLDELPDVASLEGLAEELPPHHAARVLLEELRRTPEYRGLAEVASRLLSCTSLPRKLSETEDQELGGFSDLTNRGTPDRLLLSELAQDGLTLAVRVAMNEAMYMHRETPPSTPRDHREILIDSGVRAWGVTRVFSVAAALAFVATSCPKASLKVWRGSGGDLSTSELWTRSGLIDHLSAIEADAHLARCLPKFETQVLSSDKTVEAVLIMPEDSYTESALVDALNSIKIDRLFVATLCPSGTFQLRQRLARGEKLIRRAQFNLEQLFGIESSIVQENDQSELPAYFLMHPSPILSSGTPTPKMSWWAEPCGALSISSDGRLLYWTRPNKGAEELSDQIPRGSLLWVQPNRVDGIVRFAVGGSQKVTLVETDLTRKEVDFVQVHCDEVTSICSHGGVIFCYSRNQNLIREINPRTGLVIRELAIPRGLKGMRGRFFVGENGQWFALSHNGHSATFDELSQLKAHENPIVAVWDAVGFEGVLALTANGQLLSEEMEKSRLPVVNNEIHQCAITRISSDGLNIRGSCKGLSNRSYVRSFEICLGKDPSFRTHYYLSETNLEPRIGSVAHPMSVRKKFKSVGLTKSGSFALRSRKGGLVAFTIHQGLPLFTSQTSETQLDFEQSFFPQSMDDVRFQIRTASWSNGCQIILDSRGLLHFKPAHVEIPELTIVLSEGELTGWCNDGRTFGKQYFLPHSENYLKKASQRRELFDQTISRLSEQIRAAH